MANDDKPKLPKRLYYRLSEAAQELGCTTMDLIHWGAINKVELISKLPDYVQRENSLVSFTIDFTIKEDGEVRKQTHEVDGLNVFFACSSYSIMQIELFGQASAFRTNKIFDIDGPEPFFVRTPQSEMEYFKTHVCFGNETIEISGSYFFNFRYYVWEEQIDDYIAYEGFNEDPTISIKPTDLFITAEEVERLKRGDEAIERQATDHTLQEVKKGKTENPPLAVVGIMLKMLVDGKDANGKLIRTASNTQDSIAEVIETFADNYASRTGLSKRSISDVFSRAKKHLDSKNKT